MIGQHTEEQRAIFIGLTLGQNHLTLHNDKEIPSHARLEDRMNTHLDHRVTSSRGFDRPSAALGLIVGSVVGFGLHLHVELVLIAAAR